jgi:hypothetical protein
MSLLDCLQRVGTQENDVELFVVGVCPLCLRVGGLGGAVVGADGLDPRLVGGQVVADQEVLDLVGTHLVAL